MNPSPDIIRDFSRLQATANSLGESNVELVQQLTKAQDELKTTKKELMAALVAANCGAETNAKINNSLLDRLKLSWDLRNELLEVAEKLVTFAEEHADFRIQADGSKTDIRKTIEHFHELKDKCRKNY